MCDTDSAHSGAYFVSSSDVETFLHCQRTLDRPVIRPKAGVWMERTTGAIPFPATEPGALVEYIRDINCPGVFDFSSALSKVGVVDHCRWTGIPVFGAGILGHALESVRSVGQAVVESAMQTVPDLGFDVPKRRIYTERPTTEEVDALWDAFGRSVCKQETGMAMNRVRFASSRSQLHYVMRQADYPLQVQEYVEGIEVAYYAAIVGKAAHVVPLCTLFEHKRATAVPSSSLTGEMGTVVVESIPTRALGVFEALRAELQERHYTGLLEINTRYNPTTGRWTFLEFTCRQSEPGWNLLLDLLDPDSLGTMFRDWLLGVPTHPTFVQPCGVCAFLVGAGYPSAGGCLPNLPIWIDNEKLKGARCHPYAVQRAPDGVGFVTFGGRHMLVLGSGPTVADARQQLYVGIDAIRFFGRQYRLDIGASWATDSAHLRDAGLLTEQTRGY